MKGPTTALAAALALSLISSHAAARCEATGQITRALVTNARGGEFWVRPSNRVANTVRFAVSDMGTMSSVIAAQGSHLRVQAVGVSVDPCGPALSGLVDGGALHYFVTAPEE